MDDPGCPFGPSDAHKYEILCEETAKQVQGGNTQSNYRTVAILFCRKCGATREVALS